MYFHKTTNPFNPKIKLLQILSAVKKKILINPLLYYTEQKKKINVLKMNTDP